MPIYKAGGKKDGLQRYRVRVAITDSNGKTRQKERVAYGLEQAKLVETELLRAKKLPGGKSITVTALVDEWMDSRQKSIRETSRAKDRQYMNHHILPYIGQQRLDKLNTKVLQGWKNALDDTALSLRTKNLAYSTLNAAINYAVRIEYIPSNPLSKLGRFQDATADYTKKIDYYTPEEFHLFIAAAKQAAEAAAANLNAAEWHYYVFFNIAFYTGLRKGEINALCWKDISGNVLTVSRSVAQKLKNGDRITPPKNKASFRSLQLPTPLLAILAEHKERCCQFSGFSEENFICGIDRSLRDTTIENRNRQYAAAAGVKKLRIHDFRHSHASLLANEGINIQEIARRLGHAKIEMTWNTYSHLYPREEERAIAILNQI